MDITEETIEIEPEVFKSLNKYCDENDLSINEFIKSNLDAMGELN